ncbi:hypothetical protein [Streptomyces sp. NPDC005322]|uniref:hypothetical protein n=1 Tax=Streptomyces sp. NPDC005322 TaxID=3157032 RepID=UPI0033AF5A65
MSKLSDCDKDIRDLKRYADELERTLDNIKKFASDKSWRGPAGERFRESWGGREKEIRRALHHAKQEMKRIRKKIEDEGKKAKSG